MALAPNERYQGTPNGKYEGSRYAAWLRMQTARAFHSLRQLSQATGISRSTIYKYAQSERMPEAEFAFRINEQLAEWLDVDNDELWAEMVEFLGTEEIGSSFPSVIEMVRIANMYAERWRQRGLQISEREIAQDTAEILRTKRVKGKVKASDAA